MLCTWKTFGDTRMQAQINLGFSLLETMIVVLIAVVLAAVSFPIYSHHFVVKKRLHAEVTLERISSSLENYYVINNSYANFNLADNGFSDILPHSQYRIELETESNHYRVIAKPFGVQARRDRSCGTLSLSDTGERQISGSDKTARCWTS